MYAHGNDIIDIIMWSGHFLFWPPICLSLKAGYSGAMPHSLIFKVLPLAVEHYVLYVLPNTMEINCLSKLLIIDMCSLYKRIRTHHETNIIGNSMGMVFSVKHCLHFSPGLMF